MEPLAVTSAELNSVHAELKAVEEVLRHYSKRIRMAALENGHIDTDTEDSIKQRLISALFRFRFDGQAT